jgi:hypothetical protein
MKSLSWVPVPELVSKVPGIYLFRGHLWRVQLRIRGKVCHLGHFESFSEAVVTFNQACHDYYGSLANWWGLRHPVRKNRPQVLSQELVVEVALAQAPVQPQAQTEPGLETGKLMEKLFREDSTSLEKLQG